MQIFNVTCVYFLLCLFLMINVRQRTKKKTYLHVWQKIFTIILPSLHIFNYPTRLFDLSIQKVRAKTIAYKLFLLLIVFVFINDDYHLYLSLIWVYYLQYIAYQKSYKIRRIIFYLAPTAFRGDFLYGHGLNPVRIR